MSKVAVLFAGQGAQKPGMGKSLYDNSEAAKKIIDRANNVIPSLKLMCFEGKSEILNETVNTQPCVFAVDLAAYAALEEAGIKIEGAAGFSLGEYSALTAAEVFGFENALKLVADRASWMQEAADLYPGGMAAILGKTGDEAVKIVNEVRTDGVLEAVNFNCPGQTVAAGDDDQLKLLIDYCKNNKIKCVKLPVSGAFHTVRMEKPAREIAETLKYISINGPEFPVYSNLTAEPYDMGNFINQLADQTKSPVKFEQTILNMIKADFDTFVEVGPGATLTGFVKRISKDVKAMNISDEETLKAALAELKN